MQDHDIDNAIRMHEGDSLPGFPSPDTFEFLILPHLKKIHVPVIECLGEHCFASSKSVPQFSIKYCCDVRVHVYVLLQTRSAKLSKL